MCLGLPLALTLPTHPSHVVRKDKSRVVAHKFLSWKDEAKGLGAMLTKKEFLLLAPFFIYAVRIPSSGSTADGSDEDH